MAAQEQLSASIQLVQQTQIDLDCYEPDDGNMWWGKNKMLSIVCASCQTV